MKTIIQREWHDIEVHPPDKTNPTFELWQGAVGNRVCLELEKEKVPELIKVLSDFIAEDSFIKCSVKTVVLDKDGKEIGYVDIPTNINDLFK